MSYEIALEIAPGLPALDSAALQTAVTAALAREGAPAGEVTLLLADDARLRELNRQFRGVDAPTDVLSFPAGEDVPSLPGEPPYLGDIAISVPYAARQAAAAGHSLAAELQLLAIHGALHLLGHDHGTPGEKARMWAVQAAILEGLGLGGITPTEGEEG